MLIHHPNYTQRISNVNLGLIFRGVIFGRIFGIVYRGSRFGGLIFEGGLYSGCYGFNIILLLGFMCSFLQNINCVPVCIGE